MATLNQSAQSGPRGERPELIDSWSIVTVVEAIILALLVPALFGVGAVWGVLALVALIFLIVAALSLRRGLPAAYHLLAIFHVISLVALAGAALLFLTVAHPVVAVGVVIALYAASYLRHRGQRGWSIALQAVIAIVAIIALITASEGAQSRVYAMLGLLALYLFFGGAVRFYFGHTFDELNTFGVRSFFGLPPVPAEGRLNQRLVAMPSKLLQSSYATLDRAFGGLVGKGGQLGSAARRIRLTRPRSDVGQVILALAILAGIVIFPYLIRLLEGTIDISILISMNVALLFVVLALGLNIVVGFAGLLDLGYAAFFAIGAYTVGILTWPNLNLPFCPWNILLSGSPQCGFWSGLLIAPVVAAIFGMIIGAPTLRLRGDYLAIVTLAFGEIVPRVIREFWDIKIKIPFTNFYILSELGLFKDSGGKFVEGFNLTNGPQGLNPVGVPTIPILDHQIGSADIYLGSIKILPSQVQWYFLIAALGAIVLFASLRLERSRLGRAWMAIREDETAADAMGVNPVRTKLLAFALGASFSGFAGALYAAMVQAIFPELFSFLVSIFLLIIVIVSGMGNIWGVLIGGIIIALFDRVFLAQIVPEFIPGGDILQRWRWVMYAAGLIAIMIFRPEGLFPSAARKAELHEAEEELAGVDTAAALELSKEAVHETEGAEA